MAQIHYLWNLGNLVDVSKGNFEMNKNRKQLLPDRSMGVGMVIGMSFGIIFGLLADNVALGVALGVSIGAGLGAALQKSA